LNICQFVKNGQNHFGNAMKTIFNFARGKSVTLFLATLMLFYGTGCQTLIRIQEVKPQKINGFNKHAKKYVLLHAGTNLYELVNPVVQNDILRGSVIQPTEPIFYTVGRDRKFSKDEVNILNEVHIFLSPQYSELLNGSISLPVKDIAQTQLIKQDQSDRIGVALITVTALVLLLGSATPFTLPLSPLEP